MAEVILGIGAFLGSLLDGHPFRARMLLLGLFVGMPTVGLWLWGRITLPGDLAGGATWRYRDRGGRLGRFRPSLPALADPGWAGMTRGWWMTRIEFLAAIVAAGIALLAVLWSGPGAWREPAALPMELAGLAGIVVGIGLMVRLYRAPGRVGAAARWRYRDPA